MLTIGDFLAADDETREATVQRAAEQVGGRVVRLARGDGGARPVFSVLVRDKTMIYVPGGTVTLGLDLTKAIREEDVADAGALREFLELNAARCSPTRVVTLAPFLLELAPSAVEPFLDELDEEADLLESVAARIEGEGFRLPTDDEWEHAVRAGSTDVFRWGGTWPTGIPYGKETSFTGHLARSELGLEMLDDTYGTEIVASPLGFRGGDGGEAVCGDYGGEHAWFSLSPSYRAPRDVWEDVIMETLETSHVRRALSLPG